MKTLQRFVATQRLIPQPLLPGASPHQLPGKSNPTLSRLGRVEVPRGLRAGVGKVKCARIDKD
jgi:hypothetical protein